MKVFTLFWLDGTREVVKGIDIADAMRRAGYGGGALTLDFYTTGDNDDYIWSADESTWRKKQ